MTRVKGKRSARGRPRSASQVTPPGPLDDIPLNAPSAGGEASPSASLRRSVSPNLRSASAGAHGAAVSPSFGGGGVAATFSASFSGLKRGADEAFGDDEEIEGPTHRVAKRFRAPPALTSAPALRAPVSVEDACAFVAAAGVTEAGGVLAALQAALREEDVDGEALLATSEAELRAVLQLSHAVSRRKLALALRDVASAGAAPPDRPPPPTPQEVADWLRAELRGAAGDAAAAAALRDGLDGRVLTSLSDSELCAALDIDEESRLAAILAPLRRAASAPAAQPHGYVPAPLPARGCPGAPLHHVVVLGDTGAGKSSLFNALVGERRLLPTNGMRACTATIVELSFNRGPDLSSAFSDADAMMDDQASPSSAASAALYAPGQAYTPYVAVVEFLSAAEWRVEVDAACAALNGGGDPDAPLAEPEADTPAHEAWCKVRAAYGRAPASAAALRADASLAHLLGDAVRLQARSGEELYDALAPYADSVAAEGDTDSGAACGRQLWPLVRRVRVAGPWAPLAAGAVLVDAPGVADSDAGRGAVVRACLRRADAVWLVANARRAVNDKTVKDALLRPFRRRLASGAGRLGSIALVATQTDTLVRSEIADNLRLPPEATLADCAAARNEYTQRRIEADFWAGVDDDAPDDDENDAAAAASPRGPREALVRGAHVSPVEMPTHCKWQSAALRRAATPASWGGWVPAVGDRGVVVLEFAEPRLTHPSPAFCVLQFGARFAVFAAASLAPVPSSGSGASMPQSAQLPGRYRFQFPVFCVSAFEYGKLSGLRPDDGAATTFPDVEATGVLSLKRFLADSVAATRAAAASRGAAGRSGPDGGDVAVPLLDVLREEEAQLEAEQRAFEAEAARQLQRGYAVRLASNRVARELAAVQRSAAQAPRAEPEAAGDQAAAPGVRAGALLLDCIAEAREAAAAAEAAAEDGKSEEEEAMKHPWTCAAVINPPGLAARSPGIPAGHPAFSKYGAEFGSMLTRFNTQLRSMPAHGAAAFDVAASHMDHFLDIIGHKGSITQHVLGAAVQVIPMSARRVYLRRCAAEHPRSCGFVNAPGTAAEAPAACSRCAAARPPPTRMADPRLLSSDAGDGPFWTCLRPQQAETAGLFSSRPPGVPDSPRRAALQWRGTPRCGFFNTRYSASGCGRCSRMRLEAFSLPPAPGAAAIACLPEAELRQLSFTELANIVERRGEEEVLASNTTYGYGAGGATDVFMAAAVVHATNEVLAGRPRPPLPPPPAPVPRPRASLLPHHYSGAPASQPKAAAEAAAPPGGQPRFIAGPYAGAKPGYLHRNGAQGRGYYWDDEVTDSDFFSKPASQPSQRSSGGGARPPKPAKPYVVDADGAIDLTLDDD